MAKSTIIGCLLFVSLLLVGVYTTNCDNSSKGNNSNNDSNSDADTNSNSGRCVEQCSEDSDCKIGYTCVDQRCACHSDDRCKAESSRFTTLGCTSKDECTDITNGYCINWKDNTFCAQAYGDTDCNTDSKKEKVQTVDGGEVNVCISRLAFCDPTDKRCFTGCIPEMGCSNNPDHPNCNNDTHKCECTSETCRPEFECIDGQCRCRDDSGCEYSSRGPVCNTETHRCECQEDSDCVDTNGDICVDGVCKCSDASVCTSERVHPNTTFVCI